MYKKEDDQYQRGLIITDDIAVQPILDFELYQKAILNIIKNSYPQFTVGIYGEWGTGKTTLMRSIFKELKQNNSDKSIIPVWFNAWLYERENQFALFPLLKTIANAIPEDDDVKKKELKNKITNFAKGFGKGLLQSAPEILSLMLPSFVSEFSKQAYKGITGNISEQFLSLIDKIDQVTNKDLLYSDWLGDIDEGISKIRKDDPSFRIVIFIDDLDRCSPERVLEIFESIKVFLGIDGFIYVLGVSHNKVSQLITSKYGIEGEQYIKKIIQIPITLQEWNTSDIKQLLNSLNTNKLIHEDHQKIINEKIINLISTVIEQNPREVKRFLNTFIVAYEIYKKNKEGNIEPEKLLILQILNMFWNDIYKLIITSNGKYLDKLIYFANNRDKLKNLTTTGSDFELLDPKLKIIQKFASDEKFWEFFKENYSKLEIKEWSVYRRATKVGEISLIEDNREKEAALKLLKTQILDFNRRRKRGEFYKVDLSGNDVDLSRSDLSGVDLSDYVDLSHADLSAAIISDANLSHTILCEAILYDTDLSNTDLSEAKLVGANLSRSDLYNTDLHKADLSHAKFYGSVLSQVDLSQADLSGANLSNSIIIKIKDFKDLKLDNTTNFENSIIDDAEFIDYIIKGNAQGIPTEIKDLTELEERLKAMHFPKTIIETIKDKSKFNKNNS